MIRSKLFNLDKIKHVLRKLYSSRMLLKNLCLSLILSSLLIQTIRSQEDLLLDQKTISEYSFEELSKKEDSLEAIGLITKLNRVLDFHIQKARKENDSLELISIYNWRVWNENFETAKIYSDSAIVISEALKNEKARALSYYNFGAYSYLESRPIEGLKMFMRSYKLSDSIRFINGSIESLNGIAAIKREYGLSYQALEIQKFSLDRLENYKHSVDDYFETLAYTLDATSKCFLKTKQQDSAIHYAKRGQKVASILNDPDLNSSFKAVIGQSLFGLGHYKESEQMLNGLINNTSEETLADIHYYLGKISLSYGDIDLTTIHFSSFDSIVRSIGYPRIDHAEEVYLFLHNNSKSEQSQVFLKNLVYYDSLMDLTNAEVEKISSINFKLSENEFNGNRGSKSNFTSFIVIGLASICFVLFIIVKPSNSKRTLKPSNKVPNKIVLEVLEQLKKWEQNHGYLETNITQVELASLLGTNSSYLSKVINEKLGVSYSVYIKDLRTSYIIKDFDKDYLSLMKKSMIQLAEKYGFRSQDSFVRAFKEKTGKTPSLYLKEKRYENC